jgi:hypothetical protein
MRIPVMGVVDQNLMMAGVLYAVQMEDVLRQVQRTATGANIRPNVPKDIGKPMKTKDLISTFSTAKATLDTKPYDGRLNQLRKDMAALEQAISELEDDRPWWKRLFKLGRNK